MTTDNEFELNELEVSILSSSYEDTARNTRRAIEDARSLASVHVSKGILWPMAGFLLINAALGAGVLHFPSAYFEAGGILPATLVQIHLMFLLSLTMIILASVADLRCDNAYHDVVRTACGPVAQRLAALSVVLACYGASVSFLVIIGDQYDRLFSSLYGSRFCDVFYLRREFTISATSVVFIFPFCFFRRLDFLKFGSILGVMVMVYPILLIILAYCGPGQAWIAADIRRYKEAQLHSIVDQIVAAGRAVPTVCFAYQTHEVVVPIYANLRNRHLYEMLRATLLCMAVLFTIYSTTGILGCITFGAAVRPDVIQNFDANSPYVLAGIVVLIIKMVFTYPLLVVCGRGVLERVELARFKQRDCTSRDWSVYTHYIITLVWFATSLMLATTIYNLTKVIDWIGGLACANIFIFPGMCLVGISTNSKEFRIQRPVLNLLVGIVLVLIGLEKFRIGFGHYGCVFLIDRG
ncbi:putative sodium-coupled neutral amino acid transporter 7 isoform X2 [Varroa jacobsoni]|uniref:Amino acid transporter transmembrane domain-containing protein n=1 Tax=Varroa destructor TaxID=109461 RepID=A0A7M7KBK7_VARDE|nr:putative sodium-coupled neutral amino acid transporter 7 isoform X2 [Varroa destructor]XP_022695292.1 putative sodium-coupled neutral amino acid transporter 7 isoform X2 [Varroa jacobsoni]